MSCVSICYIRNSNNKFTVKFTRYVLPVILPKETRSILTSNPEEINAVFSMGKKRLRNNDKKVFVIRKQL